MKEDKYLRNFILVCYIVSLACIFPALFELIGYWNDQIIKKSMLTLFLVWGILWVLAYIFTFVNDVSVGRIKKSPKIFIIGFVPVLITSIFNISVYFYLSPKI